MRQGRVPGCRDTRESYTGIPHIRFGLTRYTVAALFFCTIVGVPPDRMDWTL